MDIVASFPHEWQCECGRRLQAMLPERGFVIQCVGCGREHGPFELADRPARSDSTSDIAIRESLMLDDQSGADVLSRFIRVGDSAKPWTWTEHSAAVTLAIVEEMDTRWDSQNRIPGPHGVKRETNSRDLPIDRFSLLQGFLNLMERADEAPHSVREKAVFGQLYEKIEEFPNNTVSFFNEPILRRLLVSSLRLRPTTLKLEWLWNARHEFRDDASSVHESMLWLMADPTVPKAVKDRAQEHLQFEREWEQNRAEGERAEERSTAIARHVILGIFGVVAGFMISRAMLTVPRESQESGGLQQLAPVIGMGFFAGFFLFVLSTIRPIPVPYSAQASLETRNAILRGLALWVVIGVTCSVIGLLQLVWHSIFATMLSAAIDPVVGIVTGLLGTYVISFSLNAWDRRRTPPKADAGNRDAMRSTGEEKATA